MATDILLVEDDNDLRDSLCELLELNDYNVTAVATGKAFRQQLAVHLFDVAIIDIELPDSSGLELANETRKTTSTRIIFLTGRGKVEDRIRGYQSGGHLYLTKPVDSRELVAAVDSLGQAETDPPARENRPSSGWRLDVNKWLLISPKQKRVELTSKESKFVKCLAGGNKTISREKVLLQLYRRNDEYSSRALNSLIHRLKAKTEQKAHQPLPLQTSYSEGFQLSETITLL